MEPKTAWSFALVRNLSPVILVRRGKGQTANHPPCRSIDSATPFSTGYQDIENAAAIGEEHVVHVLSREVCGCHTSPESRLCEAEPHGSNPVFGSCRRQLSLSAALVLVVSSDGGEARYSAISV